MGRSAGGQVLGISAERSSGAGLVAATDTRRARCWRGGVSVLCALALLVALLTGCRGGGDGPGAEARTGRPNLVLLVLDDLDTTTTRFWEAMPRTAELLRDRGLTFENMFATDPVCCPARATLLTGMYPHNTRVFSSDGGLESFRQRASKWSIGVRLKEEGYTTAFIGKYLNGYELDPSYVPPGWDEWFGLSTPNFLTGYNYGANHNGRMERFGEGKRDYQTDVLDRVATDFVETEVGDAAPLLLTVFPSAPHAPIGPAPRHQDNPFADDLLPEIPNLEEDLGDKPSWLRDGHGPIAEEAEATALSQYRRGLGSLLAVDEMIASIASSFRQAGELDDTVFVLTSDNGYSFGSHQFFGKLVPYEESVRVPLVIAGPGIRHGTTDRLAGAIDIAPTLYELAGHEDAADVDGVSLLPLAANPPPPMWRDDLLIQYRAPPKLPLHTFEDVRRGIEQGTASTTLVPDYRSLRTTEWQYVEWYSGDEHEYELYDVVDDPVQLDNKMADPAWVADHQDVVDELQARLEELAACSGAECRA